MLPAHDLRAASTPVSVSPALVRALGLCSELQLFGLRLCRLSGLGSGGRFVAVIAGRPAGDRAPSRSHSSSASTWSSIASEARSNCSPVSPGSVVRCTGRVGGLGSCWSRRKKDAQEDATMMDRSPTPHSVGLTKEGGARARAENAVLTFSYFQE